MPEVKEYAGKQYKVQNGTYYSIETPDAVITALENARMYGYRVRIWTGNTETGRSWGDEYGVTGTIGRSMGPVKIPLLISSHRAYGGEGVLDSCILKIVAIQTRRVLYQHPEFNLPVYTIGPVGQPKGRVEIDQSKYSVGVYADGELETCHKSMDQAQRWIAFMTGERMSK